MDINDRLAIGYKQIEQRFRACVSEAEKSSQCQAVLDDLPEKVQWRLLDSLEVNYSQVLLAQADAVTSMAALPADIQSVTDTKTLREQMRTANQAIDTALGTHRQWQSGFPRNWKHIQVDEWLIENNLHTFITDFNERLRGFNMEKEWVDAHLRTIYRGLKDDIEAAEDIIAAVSDENVERDEYVTAGEKASGLRAAIRNDFHEFSTTYRRQSNALCSHCETEAMNAYYAVIQAQPPVKDIDEEGASIISSAEDFREVITNIASNAPDNETAITQYRNVTANLEALLEQ